MPKIINNLEEKIIKVALELFSQKGYQAISMKKIADEVGIAVGTLYNYFPNKRSLFINIFKKSWKKTFAKIQQLKAKDLVMQERLEEFAIILYDDISDRKGLGGELFKDHSYKNNKLEIIKEELVNLMVEFIAEEQSIGNLDSFFNMERVLAESILITIANLSHKEDNNRQYDIKFIKKLIHKLI